MSAIQSGANLWIDGFARFTGGQVGRNFRSGALNATASQDPAAWGTNESDSITSIISDVEEEGEAGEPQEESHANATHTATLSEDLEAGLSELEAADEIVAATAKHIGVIEAAMRKHQSGRMGKFDDQEASDSEDPTDESFAETITGDMMQSPILSFASALPTIDRMRIFSLLS